MKSTVHLYRSFQGTLLLKGA